jgi:putative FmdB family regulatory protein
MPIYEYRCASCGFQKEFLQKVSDPLHTTCPDCGQESFQKMLSAAGFQLKGSGWYATDFKNSGAKPASKNGAAEKPASGSDKSPSETPDPASVKPKSEPAAAPSGATAGDACPA